MPDAQLVEDGRLVDALRDRLHVVRAEPWHVQLPEHLALGGLVEHGRLVAALGGDVGAGVLGGRLRPVEVGQHLLVHPVRLDVCPPQLPDDEEAEQHACGDEELADDAHDRAARSAAGVRPGVDRRPAAPRHENTSVPSGVVACLSSELPV